MTAEIGRKSGMTLLCPPTEVRGHGARIVVREKDVDVDIELVDPAHPPSGLSELNPGLIWPTLLDRDVVLYESRIVMEYLDERFPHPPLNPMDPVARAKARLLIYRIDRDWYGLLSEIDGANEKKSGKSRKLLNEKLLAAGPLFAAHPFFLSDEFSLVDCVLAPLLWRLPALGINAPVVSDAIAGYARRIFGRESFLLSLSDQEREMDVLGYLR
ncbi:glutathione S-transferase N-terminal domain-containing protein [Candidatus Methylospira mobilis]|nr:glutathione S-transferase N-terminal domain-containing protein [Candidatus Methylospira mobilis]WNV03491.1 glutathione S-transferase N-terminal domain-containing protein [Candidatus Methylospira mobilis]